MVSSSGSEEQGPRRLDNEIRGMISALTRRLTDLGKPTAGLGPKAEEGDHGVRIITLAGDNKGATMRAGLDEVADTGGVLYGDERTMSAYTNSNYQAVNNSMVLGGSCTAEDPGVHVIIADYVDDDEQEKHDKKDKKEKKKKKSSKEAHPPEAAQGEKSGDDDE